LFGTGGGIGFAYFLFERRGSHPIYLGTRIHTRETERPEFFQTICARLGVRLVVQNSSSATAALGNLTKTLAQGQPVLVWTDAARLPYTGLSGFGSFQHVVIAYGLDADKGVVDLSDRPSSPVTVTTDELRRARETSWSPKYRAATVEAPAAVSDPRTAALEGIRSCVEQMTTGLGIANFGLRGMQKWATMLLSSKEKKSWLKIFPPGGGLYCALFSIYEQICSRGAVGAACRTLFADFLQESAELLAQPALREVAAQYRELERSWRELASAHLPDSVPEFTELRRMAGERMCLFETEGAGAQDRLRSVRERVEEIERQMSAEFPLDQGQVKGLLGELRQKIQAVREAEGGAIEALNSALR